MSDREKYLLDEVVLRLERYRVAHAYGDADVTAYAREIIDLTRPRATMVPAPPPAIEWDY